MNLNNKTNTELFRLFVENGDKVAMSLFFQNQSDLFYRVALKYTKNSADAEDMVQSAFVKIIDRANQYKGLQSNDEKLLQSWCLSIVVHSSLNSLRANSTRKNNESNYSNLNNNPIQEEENMEAYSENEAIHKKVKEAIIQLPEKYRIPIHLKYVEGFELEAIAGILQLNANTLRSIIKRGLEKISEQLKDEKITLSSVGLIGLIETLPMEKAPMTIKSMASNVFNITKESSRLISGASAKTTIVSLKSILGVITISLVGVLAFFSFANRSNLKESPTVMIKKPEQFMTKEVIPEIKNTNGVWLKYLFDSEANKLIGNYQWSKEKLCLVTEVDKPLMLSFPINNQKMPFVLECLVAPNVSDPTKSMKILFRVNWAIDKMIQAHEFYPPKDRLVSYTAELKTQKFYFYQNFICTYENEKLNGIYKYKGELSKAHVSILSKNMMIQKIESRTINNSDVPSDMIKTIEEKMNLPGVAQDSWEASEEKLAK